MQRIKRIDQSGTIRYFFPQIIPSFSRFDHSIGVWGLVKKFSKSKQECYAALLHDVSHPAFSHMLDFSTKFSKEKNKIDQRQSFQDEHHLTYLKNSGICEILQDNYQISLDSLNQENESYKCLEQKLPDLCADRIEYNIHTALLMKKITKQQAKEMITSLCFKNDK
jgi:HD superfamily phosphohydrolase